MESRDERIRQRAHELWEQAGKPEGREIDFWLQAEREQGEGDPPTGDPDAATQPNKTTFPS
jgi:hypothetical protein